MMIMMNTTIALRTSVVLLLWMSHLSRRFLFRYVVSILLCFTPIHLAYADDFPRCLLYWLVGITYLIDPQMRWVLVVDVCQSYLVSVTERYT